MSVPGAALPAPGVSARSRRTRGGVGPLGLPRRSCWYWWPPASARTARPRRSCSGPSSASSSSPTSDVLLAWRTMLGLDPADHPLHPDPPIHGRRRAADRARAIPDRDRARARLLVLRAVRRPGRALAPHRARAADRRAASGDAPLDGRQRRPRQRRRDDGRQELHVLPQLPAARLLHRQRRPLAEGPRPDAQAARRRRRRSSRCASLVEWKTTTNFFGFYSRVMPFLHYVDEGVAVERGTGIRARGSAQHPIALSAALVMLVPLAFYLYQRHRKLIWVAAAGLLTLGALSTGSRTGTTMLIAVSSLPLHPAAGDRAPAAVAAPGSRRHPGRHAGHARDDEDRCSTRAS